VQMVPDDKTQVRGGGRWIDCGWNQRREKRLVQEKAAFGGEEANTRESVCVCAGYVYDIFICIFIYLYINVCVCVCVCGSVSVCNCGRVGAGGCVDRQVGSVLAHIRRTTNTGR
jgi:hypothetical protein